jgi:ribokinase
VLTPNETEAMALLGLPDGTPCSGTDLAAELRARSGARSAIVTLGAEGAAGADERGTWTVPAPEVAVIDTTGPTAEIQFLFEAITAAAEARAVVRRRSGARCVRTPVAGARSGWSHFPSATR